MANAKRGSNPRGAVAGLVLAAMAVGTVSVVAQEPAAFRLTSISGQLAGSFDGSWVNAPLFDPRSVTRWQEWLELRIGGSVIHPRVASFQVTARPLLAQGRYLPQIDSFSSSASGNGLTGDARLELFRGSTLSGLVAGRKTHGFQRSGFGGVQRYGVEQWEVEFRDNDRRMPARVSYVSRDEQRDLNTGITARRVFREEATRTFTYLAQSSKTRLFFEQKDFRRGTDFLRPGALGSEGSANREELHFLQRQGQATHQLRWGRGSNLFSQLRYIDRTRALEFSSLTWSEGATLRQSRKITSQISGTWTRQSSPGGRGSATGGRYRLVYQATRSIRLEMDGETRTTRSGDASRTSSGVGPRARALVPLPAGARLNAFGHASYRWNSQKADGALFAEAVQESHRADAAGVFQLDNPFADPTSIVVSSASGDDLYEEGLDFRVVLNGPFVEIHVLPGSRIEGDQEVVVDYRYEVVPAVSGRGLQLGYDISLSMGPLVLSARRNKQEDLGAVAELPPGTVHFLGDEDRSVLTASVSQSLGRLLATISVSDARYSARTFESRSRSAQGRLSVVLFRSVTLTSSATRQQVTSTASDFRTERAEQSLRWQLHPSIRVTGLASYWRAVQGDRDESRLAAGGAIDVGRRRRTLTLRYDYGSWRTAIRQNEHRLSLGLSQKF